jgi:TRAP-type C4-dicarboxylate transport system permease large subunit
MLTVPIFFPVIEALHYNPIWFGVIIVVVTQMGVISRAGRRECVCRQRHRARPPTADGVQGRHPFLVCLVAAAAILVAFPIISLWLPSLAYR